MGFIGMIVIAVAIAYRFEKKLEETLAPAVMLSTLILYLCGRYVSFSPGYICVYVLMGGSLIYCIYGFVKDRAALKNSVFTWGTLALFIYMAFFAYFAFHRDFNHPDELYCWGLAAKNYYYFGEMFNVFATDFAGDQTPFLPIWMCFGAKTWVGFSDSICYFYHNMFTISLLLPVFAGIRSRITPRRFFVILAMLPSVLLISGMDGFERTLADIIIAAAMCFFMMNSIKYLKEGGAYYAYASLLALISIVLLKRIGVVFAGLMLLCILSAYLNRSVTYIREFAIGAVVSSMVAFTWFGVSVYSVVPVLIPVGGLCLYAFFRLVSKLPYKLKQVVPVVLGLGIIGASGIFALAFLCNSGYGYAVVARFLDDLFSISVTDGYICFSFGFFMLFLILLVQIKRKYDPDVIISEICLQTLISMALYIILMLYMHIHSIGTLNGNMESLIPRYIIPWEILVVFLFLYTALIDKETVTGVRMLVCFMIVLLISDTGNMYRNLFEKHRCVGFYALEDAGVDIKPGDMIYYIDEQASTGYSDREFYYHAFPAKTNFIYNLIWGTNGRLVLNADGLESELMGLSNQYFYLPDYIYDPYDYVYLQSIDDDFADRYGRLFEDPMAIAPGTAYRVVREEDGVVLQSLNN